MKNNAQISLELGLAFVLIFLLLLASVKLSVWIVSTLMQRNDIYESSRPGATYEHLGAEIDEDSLQPLRFFGEE